MTAEYPVSREEVVAGVELVDQRISTSTLTWVLWTSHLSFADELFREVATVASRPWRPVIEGWSKMPLPGQDLASAAWQLSSPSESVLALGRQR